MPPRNKTSKARLRSAGPPSADIEAALQQLRSPGTLCYANLWGGNQGISAELSFNTASMQSPSGSLEIVLREARLDVTAQGAVAEWSWNQDFSETANTLTSAVDILDGAEQAHSHSDARETEGRTEGKVEVKAPFLSGLVSATLRGNIRKEDKSTSSQKQEFRHSRNEPHIRHERTGAGRFRINFSAYPKADLTELNPSLVRMPLIDVPEPSALDFKTIRVDLHLANAYDDGDNEVRHAFAIHRASGAWRDLKDNCNKKILAELLLSKFLPQLHATQQLFPHEAGEES